MYSNYNRNKRKYYSLKLILWHFSLLLFYAKKYTCCANKHIQLQMFREQIYVQGTTCVIILLYHIKNITKFF